MAQAWADGVWATNALADGSWVQQGAVPVIQNGTPPGGAQNVGYTYQFTAAGDTPITWSVVAPGALPTGLTLSAAGLLSGTPTVLETQAFTVRATNVQGTDDVACSVTIGTAATGTGADRQSRSRAGVGRGLIRLVGR